MAQITNILDAEKANLDGLLLTETDNYILYVIKKTLAYIELFRQQTGESLPAYHLRINEEVQRTRPGYWRSPFWNQLDAAVAAETAEGAKGGKGRES